MRGSEMSCIPESGERQRIDHEGWAVRLQGIAEPLAVSRRQLPAVRAALRDASEPSV